MAHLPLLRFSPEIISLIADCCDLPTLLTLRLVSGDLGEHVESILDIDRTALLDHYVPDSGALLEHMEATGAIVGGLAALSFVLRDVSIRPAALAIYVGSDQGEYLEQLLDEDEDLDLEFIAEADHDPLDHFATPAHTTRMVTYRCRSGRFLKLYTSISISSLDPIAVSPTTALINWMSTRAFGCGYPALTMNRQAIGTSIADQLPGVPALFTLLASHGFDTRPTPWFWRSYVSAVLAPHWGPWFRPCLRQLYICPSQGRYFGDAGSLLNIFDLHGTDHDQMRARHQLPYGVSLAWRLCFGGGPCDGCCSSSDPLLPEGVGTVAAVMVSQPIIFRATYISAFSFV
ncbi:hypothetical protein VTO73DRAFT_6169 [Trametes versicolor]